MFFFGWLFREVVREVVMVVILAVETEFAAPRSYLVRIRDVKPIIASAKIFDQAMIRRAVLCPTPRNCAVTPSCRETAQAAAHALMKV
jgi:hypothetical protein